jgi:glucans biosynthesis protein C
LAFRIFRKPSATVRYCADASYWFYLAHLPIVLFLQARWQDMTWPAPVQFGLILSITVLVLLASYHWGVRHTWIGTMLNGKRTRVSADGLAGLSRAAQSNSPAGQEVRIR